MLQWIWLKLQSEKKLRKKKKELNHYYGLVSDKAFDRLCKRLDNIDEELNKREWRRYRRSKRKKKAKESYGVHREHGWYLPNDD